MRVFAGFVISLVVLATARAQAPITPQPLQAQPVQPQPQKLDPVLVQHLLGWQKAMEAVKTFSVEYTMTLEDTTTKRKEKFKGSIWCMKPNLSRMNLVKDNGTGQPANSDDHKAFISTGKIMYEYDATIKTLTAASIGANGAGNNLMLDIMSGMTAERAVARFEINLLPPKTQNDPYVYLEIKPRSKEDKSDFEKMTLVLIGANFQTRAYIPRLVQIVKPGGGKTEEWDFPNPLVNPQGVLAEHFVPPAPPKDWKVQRLESGVPTNAIPPGGGGNPQIPSAGK